MALGFFMFGNVVIRGTRWSNVTDVTLLPNASGYKLTGLLYNALAVGDFAVLELASGPVVLTCTARGTSGGGDAVWAVAPGATRCVTKAVDFTLDPLVSAYLVDASSPRVVTLSTKWTDGTLQKTTGSGKITLATAGAGGPYTINGTAADLVLPGSDGVSPTPTAPQAWRVYRDATGAFWMM